MNGNVLVIDLETTGLDGYMVGPERKDSILSVGIASVNIIHRTVTPLFYSPIQQPLNDETKKAWIFKDGHMTHAEIEFAPLSNEPAAEIVSRIIDMQYITSFNTVFDLDMFLDPWLEDMDEGPFRYRAPCLMKACTQVPSIPRTMHKDGSCWPSLLSSYAKLCDPQEIRQTHNALDDAMMAGKVLLALYDRGLYDHNREEEYA